MAALRSVADADIVVPWFRFLYLHQKSRRVGMFDQPIGVH